MSGFVIYSDVNPDVEETASTELVYNETSINKSLNTIFLTPLKNRPFRRVFGTLTNEYLFDPIDQHTAIRIAKDFADAVAKWEDRITDVDIQVLADTPNQRYFVKVSYVIPKLNNKAVVYTFNASK